MTKAYAVELPDDIAEYVKKKYGLDNDADLRLYLNNYILSHFQYMFGFGTREIKGSLKKSKLNKITDSLEEIALMRRQGK